MHAGRSPAPHGPEIHKRRLLVVIPEKNRNFFWFAVLFQVMKALNSTLRTVSLLTLTLLGSLALQAQDAAPQSSPSPECHAKNGKCHHKGWLSALNEQEISQLKAAMKQVRNDPQFVAAREAVKDAQTKEAKTAAQENLRQTRRELLLNCLLYTSPSPRD